MSLHLYNTLTRRKELFAPLDPARVTMYVCGPTVYNYAHIGNARPVVVFDILYRLLAREYPLVVYARNITDVDDKINAAAKADGVPISTITDKFAAIYRDDMAALNALPPSIVPHATHHIPQMIAMIEQLLEKNHAYEAEGHVLFHVPSFAGYGQLSGRARDDMIAGARVEVAPYKKDPADFVLWKPSTPDQPGWDSPWGRGRPGWHIECSSMIEAHLGPTIDIHGGGHDLIFPHHENELAQGTCAHGGATYARYWVHNGFLTMDKEKMSKSLGNFVTVHELLKEHRGEAIRLALLSAHYRQPLDWSDDTALQARRRLDSLYDVLDVLADFPDEDVPPSNEFLDALNDDLNTPKALAALAKIAEGNFVGDAKQTKNQLRAAGKILGILQADPDAWLRDRPDRSEIEGLVAKREEVRKARNFKEADAIRDLLVTKGVELRDRSNAPPRWLQKV